MSLFCIKKIENNKTFTQIKILTKEEKINEIAKMTSGDELSNVTIENASEMVKFATIKEEISNSIQI